MMALMEVILLIREKHIKFSGWVIIGPNFLKMQRNMFGLMIAVKEWVNLIIEMKCH
jgi:hypothetical protein